MKLGVVIRNASNAILHSLAQIVKNEGIPHFLSL